MESDKPSNQSARGVDIPSTTRNLVFHTHRHARVCSAQRIGVRSCSRATDVCPAHWCAYGPTVACGGPVTPGLGKIIECIPYVRQDQVPHIQ
jgi:hypothetical protein